MLAYNTSPSLSRGAASYSDPQDSPSSARDTMAYERPRVRAEGPGGPDVKQGARIACLDCRSAKVRIA